MPRARVTGISAGNVFGQIGLSWDYVATNKDLARRALLFLEDRRVLYAHEGREDYEYCRQSADQIRRFITLELPNVREGGFLEAKLREMRTASRDFVHAAGPEARNFAADHSYFAACLRAYRTTMGR